RSPVPFDARVPSRLCRTFLAVSLPDEAFHPRLTLTGGPATVSSFAFLFRRLPFDGHPRRHQRVRSNRPQHPPGVARPEGTRVRRRERPHRRENPGTPPHLRLRARPTGGKSRPRGRRLPRGGPAHQGPRAEEPGRTPLEEPRR